MKTRLYISGEDNYGEACGFSHVVASYSGPGDVVPNLACGADPRQLNWRGYSEPRTKLCPKCAAKIATINIAPELGNGYSVAINGNTIGLINKSRGWRWSHKRSRRIGTTDTRAAATEAICTIEAEIPETYPFHAQHRCNACGTRHEEHSGPENLVAPNLRCPATTSWGQVAKFPSVDTDKHSITEIDAAIRAYWNVNKTKFSPV